MSVAEAAASPKPAFSERIKVGTRTNFSFRLVVFVLACGLASHKMVSEWFATLHAQSPYRAVVVAPFAAGALAIYRHLSNRTSIEIHDRHVDLLTAIGSIFMALVVVVLLAPRPHWARTSLRLDLAMIPFWVFALTCGIYGTRRALDQGPAFGVLALTWPLPYSIAGSVFKVESIGWMIIAWILAATLVGAIEVIYLTRLTIFGVCSLAATVICRVEPERQWLALPVVLLLFLIAVRARGMKVLRLPKLMAMRATIASRPRRPIAVKSSRRVIMPFLFGAIIVGLLPSESVEALQTPTLTQPSNTCLTPAGWSLQQDLQLNRAEQEHLGQWAIHRCIYRVPADGTTRGIAIDIGEDVSNWELGAFPLPATMSFRGAMEPLSRRLRFDGGKADIFVFSDPTIPTATTVMTWSVEQGNSRSRRISIIVPDDRRTVASYPQPTNHLGAVLVRWMLSVTRTQTEQLRRFGVTPKDETFMLAAANSIVGTWAPATPATAK